jgi:murein DD-endopeptidase MepM/ murein hydrolase activator NlpD
MTGTQLASVLHLMRLGAVRAVCRVLLIAAVSAFVWAPAAAAPAPAAPKDPIENAKRVVLDAQDGANAAAARFSEAQSRYEQLGDQIAKIEQLIAAGVLRKDELREIASRRAVVVYKNQGTDLGVIFDAESPQEGLRSSVLLEHANEHDNAVVEELADLNGDLAVHRDELALERHKQEEARDQLDAERKLLDGKLAGAHEAVRALEEKAARDAAAAAALAAIREQAALGHAPVVDGMVCPVPGAAFSDDFGAPRSGGRSHQGNDMFAPMGNANLAVVSGNVTFGNGGAGGMGAYLEGDNGVTYVYYHLSEYVGGPRRVNQAEVIGKVGQTGNASAPHTHFEIRPSGRTGGALNPFPTISKIC